MTDMTICRESNVRHVAKVTALGRNIKKLREARGWSGKELARRAGVSSVAMIESGARPTPAFETVSKIAAALEVHPDVLYGRTKAADDPPELLDFLKKPEGRGVTAEQLDFLRGLKARGRRPTVDTYYWALKSYEAMGPEPEGDEAR